VHILLNRYFRVFHPCSSHLDFCYVLVDFTNGNPYHSNRLVKLNMHFSFDLLDYFMKVPVLAFDT
jgi:hypothetical protein